MNAQERYDRALARLNIAQRNRDIAWGEWETANDYRRAEWVNIPLGDRMSAAVGNEMEAALLDYYAADKALNGDFRTQKAVALGKGFGSYEEWE